MKIIKMGAIQLAGFQNLFSFHFPLLGSERVRGHFQLFELI
jgi:hypothetical protein